MINAFGSLGEYKVNGVTGIYTYGNSLVSCCESSYEQVSIILKQIHHCQANQTQSILRDTLPKKCMDAVYF